MVTGRNLSRMAGRDESQLLEYVDHDPLMPGH